MILLDIRTIAFSSVITDIVCTLVMVLLWLQSRKRFTGTMFWLLCFAFQSSAFFLVILRGQIPDWISIVLANTLIIIGAVLGYMGMQRFAGEKISRFFNYVPLLAIFVFVHSYFTFVQPDLTARNLNISTGMLIICFQCAWFLFYRVKPDMRQLMRNVGIVFVLYCLVSLSRIVEYFTGSLARSDYFQSGVFEQFVLISYQMLFILLTYSLALMSNKRLMMEIATQEEKFSKLSPYAIMLTRLSDGQIIEVNESFVNISGYQLADIKDKTTLDLPLWADKEDRDIVTRELASKGKMQEREFQFRKKSGEKITGLFSAEVITINNEKCVISTINDITERKRIESAVQRNEAFTREIMDNLPIGIAVTSLDPAVTFTYMNDNFPRCYRTTREALANPDSFWKAAFEDSDLREKSKKIVLDDCSSGDPARMYWKNIPLTRQGEKTTFITARNIPIPDEQLMISTVWDVTEHKQAADEISRLNKELEKTIIVRTRELRDSQLALLNLVDDLNQNSKSLASVNTVLESTNKELEAFSYSVSHDLRAPLRTIDGFSLALLEDCRNDLDENGRNYLERIRKATQHMGQLIDDMLKLARVTRAEFCLESVDLSKMFREIAKDSQKNDPGRNIDFIIHKGIILEGDPELLRIVITNLVDNACKFTSREERPKIEFGLSEKNGKQVVFIRDNGVGFDMTYADKLFGTFQRLHTKDEFTGTGIGLATVKRIITRHGGEVWAQSEVGKGAVFYFTLSQDKKRIS